VVPMSGNFGQTWGTQCRGYVRLNLTSYSNFLRQLHGFWIPLHYCASLDA